MTAITWHTDGWSGLNPDTAYWNALQGEDPTLVSVEEWHDGETYVATVKVPSNDTDSGYTTLDVFGNLAEAIAAAEAYIAANPTVWIAVADLLKGK